jgi:hypothetical protein
LKGAAMNNSNEPEFRAFRKRVLIGSLVICLFGLPIGLYLGIPYVYILSIIGILIAGFKLSSLKD